MGSKAIWNFSENSSVLVELSILALIKFGKVFLLKCSVWRVFLPRLEYLSLLVMSELGRPRVCCHIYMINRCKRILTILYDKLPHCWCFDYSTPPAKKTEPSNLVLRAQDHKKNPKFKGWQWDLKNPKFKIRSSKERRTKSEITEIVVEKYVFKIPKIQNFRNTRNQ